MPHQGSAPKDERVRCRQFLAARIQLEKWQEAGEAGPFAAEPIGGEPGHTLPIREDYDRGAVPGEHQVAG